MGSKYKGFIYVPVCVLKCRIRSFGWEDLKEQPITEQTLLFFSLFSPIFFTTFLIEWSWTVVTEDFFAFSGFFSGVMGGRGSEGMMVSSSSSLKTNVNWSRSSALFRLCEFWLLNWFARSEMTAASSVAKLKSFSGFLEPFIQFLILWATNSFMSPKDDLLKIS